MAVISTTAPYVGFAIGSGLIGWTTYLALRYYERRKA